MDVDDPDCLSGNQEYEAPSCFDGVDNDGDGWADLTDPDCFEMPWGEVGFGVTECNDDADNDSDGMIDMDDPECWDGMDGSESDWEADDCVDGLDNDADGWVDAMDPACLTSPFDETGGMDAGTECNDGIDNDGDGLADAEDPDCTSAADLLEQSGCTNGIDDDGDGWTDADDYDCYVGNSDEIGTTWGADCTDGYDNDGDGLVDADDPECDHGMDGDEASAVLDDCFDAIDNDGDGWIDALDPDCLDGFIDEVWADTAWNECNDLADNDGDGLIDIDDPSCTSGMDTEGVAPGGLLVTEVMNNPAAVTDANGEWFELHNTTGYDIDLDGWTISDLGSDSFTVSGLVVPAGDFAVLTRNTIENNGGVFPDYTYGSGMTLSNGEDEIILTDPTGVVVLTFAWDESAGWPDTNGDSMSLDGNLAPDLANTAGPGNWCPAPMPWAASLGDNGTPGWFNDPC